MRIAAASCVLILGCAHLDIAPLPASPSPEQRLSTWQALHARTETEITTCSSRGGCSVANTIQLANGDETGYAADLLPLVSPTSPTAQHARKARHHQNVSQILTGIGLVALGVAVVALFSDIDTDPGDPHQDRTAANWTLAAGVSTFLVVGVFDYWHRYLAHRETRRAFASYNKDLGEFLRICSDHNTVAPCEQVSPGGAPGEYLPPVTLRRTHGGSLAMRP